MTYSADDHRFNAEYNRGRAARELALGDDGRADLAAYWLEDAAFQDLAATALDGDPDAR